MWLKSAILLFRETKVTLMAVAVKQELQLSIGFTPAPNVYVDGIIRNAFDTLKPQLDRWDSESKWPVATTA